MNEIILSDLGIDDHILNPLSIEYELGTYTIANKDELIKALKVVAENNKDIIITNEDDAKLIYKKRASVNKIIKAIDRVRIDQSNEMKKPIIAFEKEMNEVKEVAQQSHTKLDEEYKLWEQKERSDKDVMIQSLIKHHGKGYPIEINKRWYNKTVDKPEIIRDIEDQIFMLEEEKIKYNREKAMIEKTANDNNLTPDGYVALLDNKMDVLEIIDLINENGKHKRNQAQYNAEIEALETKATQEKSVTIDETIKENEESEKWEFTLIIEATESQAQALNEFLKAQNIKVVDFK